jgi:hypothetical protein
MGLSVHRRFQFSLRTLVFGVLPVCAVISSLLAVACHRAQRWTIQAQRLQDVGVYLLTRCDIDDAGQLRAIPTPPRVPNWLIDRCGWTYYLFNEPIGIDIDIENEFTTEDLREVTEVQYVVFRNPNCDITDRVLSSLRSLTRVRRLNLNGSKLSDDGIGYFRDMHELESLDLRDTRINGKGFPALCDLARLRDLDLSGSDVTDQGISSFPSLLSLRRLRIDACDGMNINDSSAESLVMKFPNLEVLGIGYTRISDSGIKKICSLKCIKKLSLASCPNITAASIAELKKLTGLKHLCICGTFSSYLRPKICKEIQSALPECKVTCDDSDELWLPK